jgi:hypothetical protein
MNFYLVHNDAAGVAAAEEQVRLAGFAEEGEERASRVISGLWALRLIVFARGVGTAQSAAVIRAVANKKGAQNPGRHHC